MNNYEQSMIFDNLKEDLFDGIMCYGDSKNATERTYDDLAFYLYNRIMNFCGFNNEKTQRGIHSCLSLQRLWVDFEYKYLF